ncbi:MAG: DUF1573 domain-containing protein [Cyclobacteriaceae bacterium]|nr:DUF1573 domain-containing protein [Cyclobacteriaceae bacterium]
MRKLFLVLFAIATAFSVSAQNKGPVITWEKSVFDFGDVAQGDKVEHIFRFRNTGTEALIITNVQVTCGCTTPKGWARDPIAPGQTGEITVAFNSLGKFGKQNKVVTVISNAVNADGSQLTFTANVMEKKIPN